MEEIAVVALGVIEGVMEAAAFLSGEGAIYDERGDDGEVAQFEDVGGDFVMPVELLDFALEVAEAGAGALETFVCADDADVVPHEAADFVPIVIDDHQLVEGQGVAAAPFGDGDVGAIFADGDAAQGVERGAMPEHGGLEQ